MKCGSKSHRSEHCPNITIGDHPEIQQQELLYSSDEFSNSNNSHVYSFEEFGEIKLHANACNYSDSENCKCIFTNSESNSKKSSLEEEP